MTQRKIKVDYPLTRINEMFKIADISNCIVTAKDEEDVKLNQILHI